MAERKDFSSLSLQYGLIMRSEVGHARIESLELPPLDSSFLVLRGEDLPEGWILKLFRGDIPLLSKGEVLYPGQPILAIFGPDYESVEIAIKETKIKYDILETPLKPTGIKDFTYTFGAEERPSAEELEKCQAVESTFTFDHTVFSDPYRYTTTSWRDGRILNIECPVQWEGCVIKNVSTLTGVNEGLISIEPVDFYARSDEYLLSPVIYACLTALATTRNGRPAKMRGMARSAKPGYHIKKTSWFNKEREIVFEEAEMTVDQGAVLVASEEIQRQAMAGLIPLYPVKSFKGTVSIKRSKGYPASFSGDLGYNEAVAASSCHLSKLPPKNTLSPIQLLLASDEIKTRFNDMLPSLYISDYADEITRISDRSSYNRKWMANSLLSASLGLMGKRRGIGFAMGVGIAGFSSSFAATAGFEGAITYTQKKNVTITSSGGSSLDAQIWRETVEGEMDLKGQKDKGLVFSERKSDAVDSGPDTLSRFTGCFTARLKEAAHELESIKDKVALPHTIHFSIEKADKPCEFDPSGFGALIMEISIRENDYRPLVHEIWSTFVLGTLVDRGGALEKIKRGILFAISSSGAELSDDFRFNVDLRRSDDEAGIPSSISSITESITMGALSAALRQAAGEEAGSLPTGAKKLERIISGGANES